MQYTVTFQGVPIGAVELQESELAHGVLEPLDAYEAVRPTIRRASLLLMRTLGGPGTPPLEPEDSSASSAEALGEAAALRFELQDDRGNQVATDFVNLIEPFAMLRVQVVARFRGAPAGVLARRPPPKDGGSDQEPPPM
jgi:hypothetical protein